MSTIVNSTKLSERDIINSNKLFLKIQKKKKLKGYFLTYSMRLKLPLLQNQTKSLQVKKKAKDAPPHH